MANEIDIDGLSISIEVNSEKATQGLDNMAKSARNVKKAVSDINAGKALGNIKKEADDSTKGLTNLEKRMESLFAKGNQAGKNFFNVDKLGISELRGKLQSLTNQYNKAMDTINTKMVSGIFGGKTFDNAVINAGKLATRMDIIREKIEAIQTAQSTSNAMGINTEEGFAAVKKAHALEQERIELEKLNSTYQTHYGEVTKIDGSYATSSFSLNRQKEATAQADVETKKLTNDTMTMGEAWKNTFGFIGQSVKNLPSNIFGALSDKISAIKEKLASIKEKGLFSGIKGKFSEIISESDASTVSKRASKIASALKKLSGFALKNLSGFTMLKGGFNKLKEAGKHLSKSLSRVSKMFSLMLLRMALRKVIDGIKTGFQNLAQYSDTVSASIGGLKDSLSYLGNSFAAAFAPIINTVAPILSAFIDYLVGAINAINQLISSLLGFGTWTKATKLAQNYGKAVGGAGKAAKELNKQLQGFDELNNLTTNDGAGGGGGGGASTNYADMFTTEEVDGYWKSIADRIKDTWNFDDADFTWLGDSLGRKVSEQFDKLIDLHPTIKDNARKAGKAIGTLITGFVEVPDLGYKTGLVIANAIDVGVSGLNGFFGNVHWDSVGKFIGDGINGISDSDLISDVFTLLKNVINGAIDLLLNTGKAIDFEKLGTTIGTSLSNAIKDLKVAELAQSFSIWITGALKTITSFLKSVDFEEVGKKIAEFFKNIDWKKIGIELLNLAGAILEAIVDAIKGLIKNGDSGTAIGMAIVGVIATAKLTGLSSALGGIGSAIGSTLGGLIGVAAAAVIGYKIGNKLDEVLHKYGIAVDDWLEKIHPISITSEAEDKAAMLGDTGLSVYAAETARSRAIEGKAFAGALGKSDTLGEAFLYAEKYGEDWANHFQDGLNAGMSDTDANTYAQQQMADAYETITGNASKANRKLSVENTSLTKSFKNLATNGKTHINNVIKGFKNLASEAGINFGKVSDDSDKASKKLTASNKSMSDSAEQTKTKINGSMGNMFGNINSSVGLTHDNLVNKFTSMKNNSVALTEEQKNAVNAKYDDMKRVTSSDTDSILSKVKSNFGSAKTEATSNSNTMSSNWLTNMKSMVTNTNTNTNSMTNTINSWSKTSKNTVTNTKANATFGVNTPSQQDITNKYNGLKNLWKPASALFDIQTESQSVLQQAYNGLKNLWGNHSATFSVNVAASASSLGSLVSEALGKIKQAFSNSGVSWLQNVVSKIKGFATGGVADKATLGIFGEAGAEALVPLERNTKWLGRMSNMLLDEMENRQFSMPQPEIAYSNVSTGNGIYSNLDNSSAIAEQNALLKEQNNLLRQIASKDVSISSRDIFNAVRSENNDYTNRTGISAFVM